MNRFVSRTANVATWALAAMPIVALAFAAHAQEVRVQYGDLSQPAQAAAFSQRLDAAASTICASYVRPIDGISRLAACKDAVRAEGLAKLDAAQRMQLSQAATARTAS